MDLREVSQWPEKAPTIIFTIKNLLRHYAEWVLKAAHCYVSVLWASIPISPLHIMFKHPFSIAMSINCALVWGLLRAVCNFAYVR